LDDGFCASSVSGPLLDAGFVVEEFNKHFSDPERVRKQEVDDKPIIQLCSKKRWVIVTRDRNMRINHVETIKRCPHTMIVATANNNKGDLSSWVSGLIKAMPEVIKYQEKKVRPWFAQYERSGKITVCKTIDCTAYTRRTRQVA
jgi:predicted nuclease of predicted toxin-antitoxin system